MNFRLYLLVFSLVFSALIHAQDQNLLIEKNEGVNPWSSLELNNDQEQFQFIIVTDRTGGHRPGVFEEAVGKINLLQPEFVMSVGDLIEGYTTDTSILNAEWDEFTGFIDQLEMPFFYVPGNHDFTNEVQGKDYLKRFGRDYYHFVYKDVLFLCLNSEDQFRGAGKGTISEPQYKYIEKALQDNPDVKYTFVFLHQPLWIQDDPKYWPQVEAILESRPHTVFAGHYHHYVKRERNNGKYVMLATTGGGSALRGRDFGEFDHVVWVTMTKAGPVVANLWLKGIWDENVATEYSESFIKDLLSSQLVQIEPVFADDFIGDKTFSIKLTNHMDVPITVSIEEGFGWDVWITVDSHKVTLMPNSVEMLGGQMHPRKSNLVIDDLRATPIKFVVSADISEESSLEIPVQVQVKPLPHKNIKKTANSPKIDGKLEEWKMLDEVSIATDNQLKYAITHNNTHLFIAAEVKDANVVINPGNSITRQDNLGLHLSFQSSIKSAKAPSGSYYLKTTVAKDGLVAQVQSPANIPADWEYLCTGSASGYNFELAIPLSHLNEIQGGDWKSLRLNWTMDDLDDASDWQKIVRTSQFPNWGSDSEIVGSGIYFKSQ
ncbi:MAG: metallophosphoesterase [Saprospiraceae bacterium]|nr:metallophosphoesterase [Saprospiraceae bacterium]